jgi:hypothetical protein
VLHASPFSIRLVSSPWRWQIIKPFLGIFPIRLLLPLFQVQIFSSALCSRIAAMRFFSLWVRDQVSHPDEVACKIMVSLCYTDLKFSRRWLWRLFVFWDITFYNLACIYQIYQIIWRPVPQGDNRYSFWLKSGKKYWLSTCLIKEKTYERV